MDACCTVNEYIYCTVCIHFCQCLPFFNYYHRTTLKTRIPILNLCKETYKMIKWLFTAVFVRCCGHIEAASTHNQRSHLSPPTRSMTLRQRHFPTGGCTLPSLVWVKCRSLPASTSAFYTLEHPHIRILPPPSVQLSSVSQER